MQSKPTSVSELFPSKYLSADDLAGKMFSLVIARVDFTTIHDRYEGDVQKAILYFQNAQKGMILNRTQASAIANICGSEKFADWVGKKIAIRPGRANNGKQTIIVDPVPAQTM